MTAAERRAPTQSATKACHVCASADLVLWGSAADPEYQTTTDRFDYLRCAACGGLSISPCPDDRLAEIYPANYYSYSGESFSLLGVLKNALDRRLYASIFGGMTGSSLSALDVGGGSGWLLTQAQHAEPRLRRTVVVDIDAGAEARARAAGHDFVLSTIEAFASDERFDLIAMLNLIEHVRDPAAILANAARHLKDGGVVLIKTPNCDSLDARLFRSAYWGGLHSPRHWSIFTPEGFAAMARRVGLDVGRLRLTQGAPFWACSVLAVMARRGWVAVSAERPMYRHPLFGPLMAVFAAFDFARAPFARTSQMFIVLRRRG